MTATLPANTPPAAHDADAPPVSVVILTHDEQANIADCIESCRWADDIHVLDSGSTDATCDIARSLGATVHHHPFTSFGEQRNWAIDHIPCRHDWHFHLDADERFTPRLVADIARKLAPGGGATDAAAFLVPSKLIFMGRWLKRSGAYPAYQVRLFHRARCRFIDYGHGQREQATGPVYALDEPYIHHSFSKGLVEWFSKHNRYSDHESREAMEMRKGRFPRLADLLARDRTVRRRAFKHASYFLRGRALWRFVYSYLLRLGILDGVQGLRYCRMISMYESWIEHKLFAADPQQVHEAIAKRIAEADALSEARVDHRLGRKSPAVLLAPPTFGGRLRATLRYGLWPRVPFRASLRYVGEMLGRLRLLQGRQGWRRAALAAHGEYMTGLLMREKLHAYFQSTSSYARSRAAVDLRQPLAGDWPDERSVPVSVLVPVKNEQTNIVQCLRRLAWARQVVVVDSQSTDDTAALAEKLGAQVYQFHYSQSGWPKKKNWALEHVEWRNEWVLILDADEHMTPHLAREIELIVTGRYRPRRAGSGDGYWLNRRFIFMDRWVKGCGYYPSYNVRLFKHALGRYERIGELGDTESGDNEIHEHVILKSGQAGYLENDFLHFAYPDLNTWIEKHNRYSSWEAHAMLEGNQGLVHATPFGSPIERRRWMKRIARRLPMRPALRFFYSYVLKRGFADGYAGYVMSSLLAWYERISIAKYKELKLKRRSRGG